MLWMARLPYDWLIYIKIEKLKNLRPLHFEKTSEEHAHATDVKHRLLQKFIATEPTSSGSASTSMNLSNMQLFEIPLTRGIFTDNRRDFASGK